MAARGRVAARSTEVEVAVEAAIIAAWREASEGMCVEVEVAGVNGAAPFSGFSMRCCCCAISIAMSCVGVIDGKGANEVEVEVIGMLKAGPRLPIPPAEVEVEYGATLALPAAPPAVAVVCDLAACDCGDSIVACCEAEPTPELKFNPPPGAEPVGAVASATAEEDGGKCGKISACAAAEPGAGSFIGSINEEATAAVAAAAAIAAAFETPPPVGVDAPISADEGAEDAPT